VEVSQRRLDSGVRADDLTRAAREQVRAKAIQRSRVNLRRDNDDLTAVKAGRAEGCV
jgi:hypothetical protein